MPIVGRLGGVAPCRQEKDFRLQPVLGEVKGHDTLDQEIKPVLEGLREDGDQIQIEVVQTHCLLRFWAPDDGLKRYTGSAGPGFPRGPKTALPV